MSIHTLKGNKWLDLFVFVIEYTYIPYIHFKFAQISDSFCFCSEFCVGCRNRDDCSAGHCLFFSV